MSVHKTKEGRWFVKWYENKKEKRKYFGTEDTSQKRARSWEIKTILPRKRKGYHGILWNEIYGEGYEQFRIKYKIMYDDPSNTIADIFDHLMIDIGLPISYKDFREMIKSSIFIKKNGIKSSLRFRVLKRDHSTCRVCGRRSPDVVLHVDHIIPISRGGLTEERNLQTLCNDCNMGKGNRPCNVAL